MEKIISLIENIIPSEWISYLYVNNIINDASVTIQNPKRDNIYLDLVLVNEWVGVAIFSNTENMSELDLSGFDYSFHQTEIDKISKFLTNFRDFGILP
jgi:hypothetical protein